MAEIQVLAPYEFFTDLDGTALEAGKIYVGEVGLDPKTNPVSVFVDDALTVPIAQPIRTIAGIPTDTGGGPVELFVDGEYSITVDDKNDVQVFSILDPAFSTSASLLLTGGTMSGEINMGGNKITNLGTGTAALDVVHKSQMDTADALKLALTGGTLTGDLTINKATPTLTLSATNTDDAGVEVGTGRAGDGTSFVDLVGDVTFSDYGLRVVRNAGENGDSELLHRGTGSLRLSTTDLGDIEFSTNATLRVTIDAATGDVTITDSDLTVNGDINVTGLVDGRDIAADGITLDALSGGGERIEVSFAWNPPDVTSPTVDIVVVGALVSDVVLASFDNFSDADWGIGAKIISTDLVRVTLGTGGTPSNQPSGTVRIIVWKTII